MMLNKPILMEFRYDPLSKTYRFKYTGRCGISHLRGRIGNPDLVYLGQGNYWAVVATPDNEDAIADVFENGQECIAEAKRCLAGNVNGSCAGG